MMAAVPCHVSETCIISVVLNDGALSYLETVFVLVSAVSKFKNLLCTLTP